MPASLVRQWLVLTMIPKGPRRIEAQAVRDRLRARGIRVTLRTVQRDLVELGQIFPLVVDEVNKPYGWRWADGAEFLCAIPMLRDTAPEGHEIRLKLRVVDAVARTVAEGLRGREGDAREVHTQEEPSGKRGRKEITAELMDSCTMRRWLLGFGEAVEVLEPEEVRLAFQERAARLARVYRAAPRREEPQAVAPEEAERSA